MLAWMRVLSCHTPAGAAFAGKALLSYTRGLVLPSASPSLHICISCLLVTKPLASSWEQKCDNVAKQRASKLGRVQGVRRPGGFWAN